MTSLRSRAAHRPVAVALSVLLAAGITSFAAPTAWGADDSGRDTERATSSSPVAEDTPALDRGVATPIKQADAALTKATKELRKHHPGRAIAALKVAKRNVGRAHVVATNLIGAPPPNPESDEPPGPRAVLAVLGLDHRVEMRLVPLFDDRRRNDVVNSLRTVLSSTNHRRKVMVDRIVALPAEGAGADYADGMGDTLTQYKKEIQLLTTALNTYQLTSGGRTGLQNALTLVRATKAKVGAAFGVERTDDVSDA
jgi:hypothetical protein